jgi:biopolymer transport protein ExbD
MVSPNAIKVALPNSVVKDQISNAVKPIHVAITKDKKYFVNTTEVSKETLEPEIAKLSNAIIEPTVIMHLDKELAIQDEIDIMTICYKLKCKTVLATAPTNK